MSKLQGMSRQEKQEIAERSSALAFIRNPDQWPCWPRLPLKRRVNHNSETEVGVLLAQDETDLPIKVWRCNLYERINPKTTLYYEYASFEELLIEGKWRID